MMNFHTQKNTLLKAAMGNSSTKAFKRVFFSPSQEKLKNKKFASLQKNKTSQPHNQRQTKTNIHANRYRQL